MVNLFYRDVANEVKEEKSLIEAVAIESRRTDQVSKQRLVNEIQALKQNIKEARQSVVLSNTKKAEAVVKEKMHLFKEKKQEAQEELDRKKDLIQQIRSLENSQTTVIKVVDKTATEGYGLLNEMSILELQERLLTTRLRQTETRELKRNEILESKNNRMTSIARKLEEIEREREQRRGTSLGGARESKFSKQHEQELKRSVLNQDPGLKDLFEKLEMKRATRGRVSRGSVYMPVQGGGETRGGDGSKGAAWGLDELKQDYADRRIKLTKIRAGQV
jgi:hypothetical protein